MAKVAWTLVVALALFAAIGLANGRWPDHPIALRGMLAEPPEARTIIIIGVILLGHALLAALIPLLARRLSHARPSLPAAGLLALGALLALEGALLHFAPEPSRDPWCAGFEAAAVYSIVATLVLGLALVVDRRPVPGRALALPGVLLGAIGIFLFLARVDAWEREDWRKSSDPRALVHAGIAAWVCHGPSNLTSPVMSRREIKAYEARCAIERRLIELGNEAVPALAEAGENDPTEWSLNFLGRLGKSAEDSIVALLDSDSKKLRVCAIHALLDPRTSTRAVTAVRRKLHDPDLGVRGSAARFLGWRAQHGRKTDLAEVAAIASELIVLLDDHDRSVRIEAIQALGERRASSAVPRLSQLLDDPDVHLHCSLVEALGKIGDPAAVPALRRAFDKKDEVDAARALLDCGPEGAAVLLRRLDQPSALKTVQTTRRRDLARDPALRLRLQELSNDANVERRRAAARLLARSENAISTQDMRRLLREGDDQDVVEALREKDLCAFTEELAFVVTDGRRDRFVRGQALERVVAHDLERGQKLVEELLASGPRDLRCWAILPMKERTTSTLDTKTLLALLKDDADRDVRFTAAVALRDRKEPAVVAALIEAFKIDESPYVKSAAAHALGAFHAREAVPAFVAAIGRQGFLVGDHPGEPGASVGALGEIGDPIARDVLRQVLANGLRRGDLASVYEAAISLASFGETDVIPWLRHAIRRSQGSTWATDGKSYRDSLVAIFALSKLGEAGVTGLLEAFDEDRFRDSIAETLGATKSARAFEPLVRALDDQESKVRRSAALGLGKLGDKRATEALTRALEDPEPEVVKAAKAAIEELRR